MDNTRVKINLKTGEIEFEGSQEFVESQMDNLESIIDLLSSNVEERDFVSTHYNEDSGEDAEDNIADTENSETLPELTVPESFGEWMHKFKEGINGIDKALVTAYYVQNQAPKNDFKTIEVNQSLKDHGIKLANPSKSLKSLEGKKYLFQTRKEGPKIRFMRVSQDGIKFLKTLLR